VGLGDPLADAQPQSSSTIVKRASLIHLIKSVKDVGKSLCRDTNPSILYCDFGPPFFALNRKVDAPASRSVFHRIVYQIEQELFKPQAITPDRNLTIGV